MSGGYRLFIGQLVRDVRKRELEDAFGKYGEIVRIDIKNGFGFIEYEHSRDAEEAVRKMDGQDFLGRRIIVEYARGKKRERDDRRDYRRDRNTGPERSDYRVIVDGLGRGTSWQDLKDAFRSSGDILFTDVRRDRYDEYYGIVEFRRRDDIDNAIRKMEGAEINGYKIRVKEDKKKKRSRSRSEKRRRRSKSGSRERRRSKSGSRERRRSKSGSRERSPKRRSESPKRRSGSRDKSPRKSESRERSQKRKSESREGSRKRSGSRDSKPRDNEDNKSENKEENRDTENKDEQRDN